MSTPNTPREAPAPSPAEEKEQPATQQEALKALQRKAREALAPKKSRESERTETECSTDGRLFLQSLDLPPVSNADRLRQVELRKLAKKGDVPPHVLQRIETANHTINSYLAALKQDPLRESFRPENAGSGARASYRAHLVRIDRIIDDAQKAGLVMPLTQNKLAKPMNRVDEAYGWIQELQKMQSEIVGNTPGTVNMRQYIQKVQNVFQGVLNGDRNFTAYFKHLTRVERKLSPAEEQAKDALRMVALLAAAGMALISGILDIKNGQLKPYTAAMVGIAALAAGIFEGRSTSAARILGFVQDSTWERLQARLGISGNRGNDIVKMILKSHTKKEATTLLQQLRSRGLTADQERTAKGKYIALITGENPEGADAELQKKLLALPRQDLLYLTDNLGRIRGNPTAEGILSFLIENGTTSQKVAAEARELVRSRK